MKREELQELQAFTTDIIHSMRGGLVTTDLNGRVVLINRTGEEITGADVSTKLRGRDCGRSAEEFWLPDMTALPEKLSLRREIEVRTAGGQRRFLGISVSPLRTRDAARSGYVFNFQDLTELRHLEKEVATKERMAARRAALRGHCPRDTAAADGHGGSGKGVGAPGAAGGRRKAPGEHCQPGIGAPESHHYGLPELLAGQILRRFPEADVRRCSTRR